MKVLITGGTGFIGSRLALKCLEDKASVVILGQENTQAEAENTRLVRQRAASYFGIGH
jgi:nucleoside-diphosphate-sugar epimerase